MNASLIVGALVWVFVGAVFVVFLRGAGTASKRDGRK